MTPFYHNFSFTFLISKKQDHFDSFHASAITLARLNSKRPKSKQMSNSTQEMAKKIFLTKTLFRMSSIQLILLQQKE